MAASAYEILDRIRAGEALRREEIEAAVEGASSGSWSDAQLGALLMGMACRGLGDDHTRALTEAMLRSGDRWRLAADLPLLCDKHSTGGVGDKVSLVLAPLLAAAGFPVVMLTGRGLGHTGGTADKLESIPGLDVSIDRRSALASLRAEGMAIGIATEQIAPADRTFYRLRDETGTVDSVPLITASILSKKLATGAGALVLDIKTGAGAFMRELERARDLARLLVDTAHGLGCPTVARVTDMSQPLGRWAGNACEVREALDCLEGNGPPDLVELVCVLSADATKLHGSEMAVDELRELLASGEARERLLRWALRQGADRDWVASPSLPLAPVELAVHAPTDGWVEEVRTRRLGLLLNEAGAGRFAAGRQIDPAVSLCTEVRLGDRVEAGDLLARLYLRERDQPLADRVRSCFRIGSRPVTPPPLFWDRIEAG